MTLDERLRLHDRPYEIGEKRVEPALCKGLKARRSNSSYRCSSCSQMQPAGALMVWVPDSVQRGDPAWSVTDACERNALNGHSSGWCVRCARSLGRSMVSTLIGAPCDLCTLDSRKRARRILALLVFSACLSIVAWAVA